jgi:hypothetical protein
MDTLVCENRAEVWKAIRAGKRISLATTLTDLNLFCMLLFRVTVSLELACVYVQVRKLGLLLGFAC